MVEPSTDDPDDLTHRAALVVAGAYALGAGDVVAMEHLAANGFLVEPMELTILQRRLVEARRFALTAAADLADAMMDQDAMADQWADLLTILGDDQ
jgi:hypothetical protein